MHLNVTMYDIHKLLIGNKINSMHVWDVKWIFMWSVFIVVVKKTFTSFLKPFIIEYRFFLQAVSLLQFMAPGFFSASICGQFYFTSITETSILFSWVFTVPIKGKFSKSFEINNNVKVMQDNWDTTTNT